MTESDLPRADNFPSWVPQWHSDHAHGSIGGVIWDHFAAGGAGRMNLAFPAPGLLQIEGLQFDTIADACQVHLLGSGSKLFHVEETWARYAEGNQPYPTKGDIITAYAMTLACGCREHKGVFGLKAEQDYMNDMRAGFVAWLEQQRATATNLQPPPSTSYYPPGLYSDDLPVLPEISQEEKDAKAHVYETLITVAIAGSRSLFRTKRGYLGLGSSNPRTGDVVCIIPGAPLPFVLRPRAPDDGYWFIGDSYIHGIMEGEKLAVELRKLKDFHIF